MNIIFISILAPPVCTVATVLLSQCQWCYMSPLSPLELITLGGPAGGSGGIRHYKGTTCYKEETLL